MDAGGEEQEALKDYGSFAKHPPVDEGAIKGMLE